MKFLSFEIQGISSLLGQSYLTLGLLVFLILEVPSTCRVEDQYYCTMLREKTENIYYGYKISYFSLTKDGWHKPRCL